jgi:ankyrin repeat protein
MLAARRSKGPDVVAALLASGASGQVKSVDGRTAFDYAAANESLKGTSAYGALQRAQNLFELVRTATPALVTAALSRGAKAEDLDEDQWSPLMYAAESNSDPRVITVLLQAGAAIDDQDPGGWTPLMLAARANQNPEVVMTLLKAGARGEVTSSDGKTAFDWAAGNAKLKGTAAYKALERAQSFFQRVRTCSPADIQAAVAAGSDVNGRDEAGWTALMYAAQRNGDPKVIAALVKAGANLNDLTPDGLTALMLAARETRNPDVIMALLKAGADGTLLSDAGKTAYDYAAGNPKLKGTAAYRALGKARTPPAPAAAPPAPAPPATAPPAQSTN